MSLTEAWVALKVLERVTNQEEQWYRSQYFPTEEITESHQKRREQLRNQYAAVRSRLMSEFEDYMASLDV